MSKAANAKDGRYPFSLSGQDRATAKMTQSGSSFSGTRTYKRLRLHHPRIVLIYWGSPWAGAATEPLQGEFTAAADDLFSEPWSVRLGKYRGIGPISLELVAQVPHLDPPESFTNQWVRTFIDSLIARGAVSAPSRPADRIYCVVMPSGCSSLDDPQGSGQHQHYDRKDGTRIHWLWIASDGTLTEIPTIIAEQLAAEASAYPECN